MEKRVSDWLRQRHPLEESFSELLRKTIGARGALSADLQKDIDEALSELERIQSGMP